MFGTWNFRWFFLNNLIGLSICQNITKFKEPLRNSIFYLVSRHNEEEVVGGGGVIVDGGTVEVVLKALQRLTMTKLAQEVGGVLYVSCLSIFEIWGLALHLTLRDIHKG